MKIRHLAPLGFVLAAGTALANAPVAAPGGKADAPNKVMAKADAPKASAKGAEYATRDWAKIDLNKDNLISPEEMEKYLAENPGPLRVAAQQKP